VHKGTGAQGVYLHAECFGWWSLVKWLHSNGV
jgi:hypothetical protein